MKPTRVQLKRMKGWKLPPNTVVVSRPTKWGNPFKAISKEDRKGAVLAYVNYRERNPLTESEVFQLKGKNLACWCPVDGPCHADHLPKVANT